MVLHCPVWCTRHTHTHTYSSRPSTPLSTGSSSPFSFLFVLFPLLVALRCSTHSSSPLSPACAFGAFLRRSSPLSSFSPPSLSPFPTLSLPLPPFPTASPSMQPTPFLPVLPLPTPISAAHHHVFKLDERLELRGRRPKDNASDVSGAALGALRGGNRAQGGSHEKACNCAHAVLYARRKRERGEKGRGDVVERLIDRSSSLSFLSSFWALSFPLCLTQAHSLPSSIDCLDIDRQPCRNCRSGCALCH